MLTQTAAARTILIVDGQRTLSEIADKIADYTWRTSFERTIL